MRSSAWTMITLGNKLVILLTCVFALAQYEATAQDANWTAANKWYSEPDGINWLIAHYRPIYDFRPAEKVASIGAGQGVREVVYSLMADSLIFYLQDLDSIWLEPSRLKKAIRTIYKEAGRTTCTTYFIPVRGKEKETGLPDRFFDKILIENSLHEFNFQSEMLLSIRTNLKPDGQLFIWEAITKKLYQKHVDCGKPMFTDESLVKLAEENGFRFIEKTIVDPPRGKDAVFQFRLSNFSSEKLPTNKTNK